MKTDAEASGGTDSAAGTSFAAPVFAMPAFAAPAVAVPIEPRVAPKPYVAVKPAVTRPYETRNQRKLWYALAFTGHSAAVFDAWSTRRAISQGYATEANPLLRPFSHSGAMYAATQVSPLVMDLLAKHMMVSQHGWMRRMWWVPQAAGSGLSLAAGVHNVGLVP